MKQTFALLSILASAAAQAMTFTLTPITNTTPNFVGPINIMGSVVCAPGERYLFWSQFDAPFLSSFTAGFNGAPQNFTPGFLAWNGLGSYTGAIYQHGCNPTNLGWSGGMPVGLYDSNPFGPGGKSSIQLTYATTNGTTAVAIAKYAINVQAVPEPSSIAAVGLGGVALMRRRRR
ncbi:MAG: PEP-CTERM sorting domain-containing protein [Armatimonadetes bacterium]|nr:PEP-CTERM sorting domain-containing protein [Armatimonadota bacterium]